MIFSLATQVTLTFKSKKKFLCENFAFPIAVKGEWVDQTCMDTTISKQTLLSCPKMLTIGPACLLLRGGGWWFAEFVEFWAGLCAPACFFCVCLCVFCCHFGHCIHPAPLTHLFPPSYITVYTLYTVYIQFIYTVYFLWHMPVLVQSSWELYSFT